MSHTCQRGIQYQPYSTGGVTCPLTLGPVSYPLAPDIFGLGKTRGFCRSPTSPPTAICVHTMYCFSLAHTLSDSDVALLNNVATTFNGFGQT